MNPRLLGASALFLALAVSCSAPAGRIKDDSEGDLVGARTAGAAAYNQVIEEGVQALLGSHSATHPGVEKATLAVLGFENVGSEELGDWEEQMYDLITTSINRSGRYRTVSRRFVDRALSEGNLRQEDLFLPRYRRDFLAILEAQDSPVQLLLFPKLSTGTTRGEDATQRDYLLTLELVDVDSGWDDRFSSRVRKEYR